MRGKISDVMGVIGIQNSPHGTEPQNVLLGDSLKTLPQTGISLAENDAYNVLKKRNVPVVVISIPAGPQVSVRPENSAIPIGGIAAIPDLGIWRNM